jgi:7-cyano-7-deazaguanine reductase
MFNNSPLGRPTDYPDKYDSSLLVAISRAVKRQEIGIQDQQNLPFFGFDFWTGYELSWLNLKGKPKTAILHCEIPCQSVNIIESKSFKLYLNSFNQTRFESAEVVCDRISNDLSEKMGAKVHVHIERSNQEFIESRWPGRNIDHLDIEVNEYSYNPLLLKVESESIVQEELNSDLLKSNCLVTGQPDWGSIYINYEGPKIDASSLLKYLISFRLHKEFHEQCVERIFMDLNQYCRCKKLTVYARYLRRGGLDINPLRSNDDHVEVNSLKSLRLIRQ